MKKPEEMKWIVHPHSYLESRTEISVIHETEFHALDSYGWFSYAKKFIYTDFMYGVAPKEVKDILRKYAEELCDRLNKEEPFSVEYCQSKINEKLQHDAVQSDFYKKLDESTDWSKLLKPLEFNK